jgi:hypothetical protein
VSVPLPAAMSNLSTSGRQRGTGRTEADKVAGLTIGGMTI